MDGAGLITVEDEEPETVRTEAAEPAPARKVAAEKKAAPKPEPKPEPKKSKTPRQFSETKWFMVGEAIQDKDLDPELVSDKDLQKQYKPTKELPPEVRKKFSLNYGSDEKDRKK
jgi:hypothetical protein